MILIFLLGIGVGALLGWWGAGRIAGLGGAADDTAAASVGFLAGLLAAFIAILKSAALVVLAIVVLFVLAILIAPLPKH
jgi:hypothetical protein